MPEDSRTNGRRGTLLAIDTPMRLAALIVLVVEAILGILLARAKAEDTRFYVILMVAVLVVTIVMVFIIEYKRVASKGAGVPEMGTIEPQNKQFKFDVFLAAPMAGIATEADFTREMKKVEDLLLAMEQECGFKRIYFAGKNMKSKKDFDNAALSVKEDTDAIRDSRLFVLVYPEKIVSSVLYEAGIALAYGKPSFYFGSEFPFLMKEANNSFRHINITGIKSIEDVTAMVHKNKESLFQLPDA